ncbi:MAG: LysM peptidoglycan-binding domain-containing protein [Clostridia bacterium]|nr:LysM peptidoglycan-binding domain-containing protein [Clostridia bacterium]
MVGRGDNLTYIANRYHTTVANLVRINQIRNPNLIYPRADTTNSKLTMLQRKTCIICLKVIQQKASAGFFLLTAQYNSKMKVSSV